MIFGPVSAAQHSQPTVGVALFSLGVGASVLTYLWYRFWNRAEEEPKPAIEKRYLDIRDLLRVHCGRNLGIGARSWRLNPKP